MMKVNLELHHAQLIRYLHFFLPQCQFMVDHIIYVVDWHMLKVHDHWPILTTSHALYKTIPCLTEIGIKHVMFKGLKNNSLKKSPLRPHRNWEERCDDQWSVNKIKKKSPMGSSQKLADQQIYNLVILHM